MLRFLVLAIGLSTPVLTLALPEDKHKTAELQADYADLNQAQQHAEFVGHVELTQGTTKLLAQRLSTDSTKENTLRLAIAYGNDKEQAHYVTCTATDKPLLHAYADEIRYYPAKHRIDLLGNARVVQGTNVLTAGKISYDTEKQRVLSQSDAKSRVTIVIHPEK
ncbi:MAG: lipopolysaccharide transport periplasmic protein LptA [Legionellaceae bacterium]|nr:lipopolysaccharide transport periplasmic protein LptA [Legionellaceae bacterium]